MLGTWSSDHVFKPQRVPLVLCPKNLTKHLYNQSVQKLSSSETWIKKIVAIKLYAEIGHMSNQKRDQFVDDIFCMQSFWGGHGKISPKGWFIWEGQICPELFDSATGRFSDRRNSQIASSLELFDGSSESWESYLPIQYSGLPDFRQTEA
jgi:hypothetical protein